MCILTSPLKRAGLANEFKRAFKGIDQAIKQGTSRALNRAMASTKTRLVRTLREETGLKTEVIKTRTRVKKAKANDLGVILGIAIKFGISLSKFSPKEKVVRKVREGTKRARAYLGATAKIGKQPRQLVPGAFLLDLPQGQIVVGRKQAFTGDGAYKGSHTERYPLTSLKTKIFTDVALAQEKPTKDYLLNTFDNIVAHEIDFAIQKKFSDNQ